MPTRSVDCGRYNGVKLLLSCDFDKVAEQCDNPPKPSQALVNLFRVRYEAITP